MRKLKLEELNRLTQEEFKRSKKFPVTIVLDNLRSALNVGSIFRTADAFACKKIYLCGITAKPPHKEINKTAIGATNSVDWEYCESVVNLVQDLKDSGKQILGIEQTDQSFALSDFIPSDKEMVLIFGNEVEGINSDLLPILDASIEIPQYGTKHSINVAVCAGIVVSNLIDKLGSHEV